MKHNSTHRVQSLAVTAMLCAVAYLVMFVFHFKVMFLTFDLKDAVLTLAALLFGPVYGLISSALVALLEFATVSDTGPYGLIMNFLSSATFAVTAGVIYKYKRNFWGAVLGMFTAIVAMTAVMLLANYFITPYYMGEGVSRADVAAMIPTLLLPFNVCKAMMNAGAVLLLYKPLISALRRTGMLPKSQTASQGGVKTVVLMVVAVLMVVTACVVLVVKLGGTAQWF